MPAQNFTPQRWLLTALLPALLFAACADDGQVVEAGERKLPSSMEYSYDCLENTAAGGSYMDAARKGGEVASAVLLDRIKISDEDQSKEGDKLLDEMKGSGEFVIDTKDPINAKLRLVLQDLLRRRIRPSGIRYEIFLLDDRETVNAFTWGGKIFVTKAIVERCKTQDQLYAIVGHEIGHNEKGHVRRTMQLARGAEEYFGDNSELILELGKIVTAVFNQRQEVEADYYGIDLVYMLGFEPCAIAAFWHRMSEEEGSYSRMEDFLRSHPYSAFREQCLKDHVERNFGEQCGK